MKNKLLMSAFAVGLAVAAPSAVWAQPDDHHDQSGPQAGQGDSSKTDHPDGDRNDSKPDTGGNAGGDHANDNPNAGGAGGGMKGKDDDRGKNKHPRGETTTTTTGTSTDNKNDHSSSGGMRGGRNNTHTDTHTTTRTVHRTNIDITTYHKTIQSPRHFSIGIYRQPPGYSYRRWGIGERLPPAFFVRDFWLTDYASYGLIAPPGDGYVWVRFGPDAILIDEATGETVQVVYGVFE